MTTFFSLSDLGLFVNSSTLLQQWLDSMQTQFPGYVPSPANLEYVQAQIFATQIAALGQLASSGGDELFRTYGTTLLGVPYQQGVAAQAVITSTAVGAGQMTSLTSALPTSPITSLPVAALPYDVAAGTITVTDGGVNTDTFTTVGTTANATAIPVSSHTPSFAYQAGAAVSGSFNYLLPAFTQFTLDSMGFFNFKPATIVSGGTTSVTLIAVQSGSLFNGAGTQGSVQTVQQLTWLQSLAVTSPAGGGVDPEDDAHYRGRLVTRAQLMAPRPIRESDFGAITVDFIPELGTDQELVGRATAVDGFNPGNGTYNNERMVTVCVTDVNGLALNTDTMYGYPNGTQNAPVLTPPTPTSGWGVSGWLRSMREVNFIVNVIAPTYSTVYVAVTVKGSPDWDPASVATSIQTALLTYITPQNWGLPPSNMPSWRNTTKVYYSAITAVIQNASGVDHVVPGTLALGLSSNPTTFGDLPLPGSVALPTSSTTSIPTGSITVT